MTLINFSLSLALGLLLLIATGRTLRQTNCHDQGLTDVLAQRLSRTLDKRSLARTQVFPSLCRFRSYKAKVQLSFKGWVSNNAK